MGKVSSKICLLVTGTVVPNSNFVVHTDPQARLKEYYEGLLFYASLMPGVPIFFLENSRYDFSTDQKFADLFNKKSVTLMKFPVSDKFSQGKGYQEFEMLDHAVDQLGAQFEGFIKVTGRYKVHNLPALLKAPGSGLIADSHRKPQVVQTNVLYASSRFYNTHLRGLYKEVDDSKGIYIEKLVYKKLQEQDLFAQVSLFPVNPVITGISGSYGGTLNRNKIKMQVRNAERALLRLFGLNQFIVEY